VLELTTGGAVTFAAGSQIRAHEITLSNQGNTIDFSATAFGGPVNGGSGADRMTAGASAVLFYGNGGADTLIGGIFADTLDGGTGADKLKGGFGDDTYVVDNVSDQVIELLGGGNDAIVTTISLTLPSQVETLLAADPAATGGLTLTGNALANTILGNAGGNTIDGGSGADVITGLAGNDILLGGAGNDILHGGAGKDTMTGGAGVDGFVFIDGDLRPTRDTADAITDFDRAAGERIDLSLVDARTTVAGDQAFTFIGNGSFTGIAGQLHAVQSGGFTWIEGDTNGDRVADFVIRVNGSGALTAGDFYL
jgi:Ca2+-binding RTX toxin-like protein